jgi:hypothetical protein
MSGKRTWVPIVIGVAIFLAFVAIGAVVASVAYVRQHLETSTVGDVDAAKAFDEVRTRFAGRPPLVEFRGNVPRYNTERATTETARHQLTAVRVLAYDPRDDELTRFELPFWLVRLKSGPISFSAYASGLDDGGVRLTAEELERHGPGLILDMTGPRGERVLVWVE